jgi:malate dehydrogenase
MDSEQIDRLVDRTRKGGAEVVGLLKKGRAFLSPGASVVKMIEAVLLDKKRTLPCTAFLEGEHGCNGIFFGVPVTLGNTGIEQVIELKLTDAEQEMINTSAKDVKQMIGEVDVFLKNG